MSTITEEIEDMVEKIKIYELKRICLEYNNTDEFFDTIEQKLKQIVEMSELHRGKDVKYVKISNIKLTRDAIYFDATVEYDNGQKENIKDISVEYYELFI